MAWLGIHIKGKIMLEATSLLETIVATVIFLIVFGMAMTSAVNLHRLGTPDWAGIERDFNEIRTLAPEDGRVYVYDWGEIETESGYYHEVPGLKEVHALIKLKDGRKMKYRYLVCDETN
jgi:hypothetical protein